MELLSPWYSVKKNYCELISASSIQVNFANIFAQKTKQKYSVKRFSKHLLRWNPNSHRGGSEEEDEIILVIKE